LAQAAHLSGLIFALAITTLVPQLVAQSNVSADYYRQAGQQTNAATVASIRSPSSDEPSVLRIGAGDLLEISVSTGFGAPEISWKGRVSSSGDIALPFLGGCYVAGLTADQAEATIQKRYRDAEILKDPQVSVLISEYASQGVSVLGEVTKPGVYPVMTSRRLLDLISQAGGFTPLAARKIAITHRSNPTEPRTVLLSRDPSQTLTENIDVFPGDTIVVGKAGVVYVVGAVVKPGGFTMEANEGLTVLQALALAEGAKFEASLDKSMLIRKTESGREEIPVPLRKVLSFQTADLKLMPDDILFVPSSKTKSAARRALEAAVQTATGVVIYRAF
jgi:polysaccharide export outer membrane protein